ncbi:MAG: hypothetical protein UW41_C0025G0011 [Candidatus Collierbacteria bacterium GW2011_GWC2_44_18]|uniref:Uncharacterized protein n=1 Tax=Candidatus Collierbacteria bacterium GW2011_GWC2_44_18 TaxID=1618392 RepID=A0A0G1HNP5_9BACT|nr:MAG: hypothetical protein UW41_C0025G0011 [Candidatus Collierbacteria bacterium GW2011_GWC2_44_18]
MISYRWKRRSIGSGGFEGVGNIGDGLGNTSGIGNGDFEAENFTIGVGESLGIDFDDEGVAGFTCNLG